MPTVPVLTCVVTCLALTAPVAIRAAEEPEDTLAAMTGLSPADQAELAGRFRREIWPLLTRSDPAQKSCVGCHDDGEGNKSPLLLLNDPEEDFAALLAEGYLDADNPVSVLAK